MEFLDLFRQFVIEIIPMIFLALVPAVLIKALFLKSDQRKPPNYFGRTEQIFLADVISTSIVFLAIYLIVKNSNDILNNFDGYNLFLIYIVLFIVISLILTSIELFVLKNMSYSQINYKNFFILVIGNDIFLLFAALIFVVGWPNIVKYLSLYWQ
jgi:hypothetical protein